MPAANYKFERPERGGLEVRRVTTVARPTPAIVTEDALNVGRVLHSAYNRAFVEEKSLRPIELNRHLGNRGLNHQNCVRMAAAISVGAQYWLAFNRNGGVYDGNEATGMAKVTPLQPWWKSRSAPVVNVNDLAVRTPDEEVESALLFAGISDYRPKCEVVAGVFRRDDASQARLEELGFAVDPNVHPDAVDIGGQALSVIRMGGVQVGELQEVLSDKHPWLDHTKVA